MSRSWTCVSVVGFLIGFLFIVLCLSRYTVCLYFIFFFQAEDGIRDLVRSRGLGDVYKRQNLHSVLVHDQVASLDQFLPSGIDGGATLGAQADLSLIHI